MINRKRPSTGNPAAIRLSGFCPLSPVLRSGAIIEIAFTRGRLAGNETVRLLRSSVPTRGGARASEVSACANQLSCSLDIDLVLPARTLYEGREIELEGLRSS